MNQRSVFSEFDFFSVVDKNWFDLFFPKLILEMSQRSVFSEFNIFLSISFFFILFS